MGQALTGVRVVAVILRADLAPLEMLVRNLGQLNHLVVVVVLLVYKNVVVVVVVVDFFTLARRRRCLLVMLSEVRDRQDMSDKLDVLLAGVLVPLLTMVPFRKGSPEIERLEVVVAVVAGWEEELLQSGGANLGRESLVAAHDEKFPLGGLGVSSAERESAVCSGLGHTVVTIVGGVTCQSALSRCQQNNNTIR